MSSPPLSPLLPPSEASLFERSVRLNPGFLSPSYVLSEYQRFARCVIPDPADRGVVALLAGALKEGRPFSMIRIGDGEINLMTAAYYVATPILNDHSRRKILTMQQDRFEVDGRWFRLISDLLHKSLCDADIVGVLGLWRPRLPQVDAIIQRFYDDPRGVSGQWRGVDYMLHLARSGLLCDKVVASAHSYLIIVKAVNELIALTDKVVIVSSRKLVYQQLLEKYPDHDFLFINVGQSGVSSLQEHCKQPDFLSVVYKALPESMSGMLCLVGAGPWAEIYCSWVKARGGVAVDIGSGFDLMGGQLSRPVHKTLLSLDVNPAKTN